MNSIAIDSIVNHPAVLSVIVALPLFGILAKIFGFKFERIARWYLYMAVFAVAIVMDSMFFPFIGGKDFFFRFTIELSLIFFVFAWAFEMHSGELKTRLSTAFRKPLVIAVSAFTAAFLLACLFALDMHAAFWSNYERGEGGFQMIHYYLFFILLVLLLRTEKEWKNIFKCSLAAAGLMILYGIGGSLMLPTFIGPWAGSSNPPTGWVHLLFDNRFQGSLGNAAYVAAYLIFSMFYLAFLWNRRGSKESGHKNIWIHIAFLIGLLILLFFEYLAQTRGAELGFGLGLLALVLYMIFAGRGALRRWALIGLLVLVALGIGAYSLRNSNLAKSNAGGRLLQLSLSDQTAQTRFWVWGEAWQGFLERPVFGWGPANFTAVYDKFFNPNFYVPGQNGETWFDRAHSVFFDYLAETGAVGFLSYISIFAVFFWEFFKRNKHSAKNAGTVLMRGLVLAVPIAYLGQGVAIFDVLPMYLNLFLFAAFAYYFFYEYEDHKLHEQHA